MSESEIDFCTDLRAEGAKVSLRAEGANVNMFRTRTVYARPSSL